LHGRLDGGRKFIDWHGLGLLLDVVSRATTRASE